MKGIEDLVREIEALEGLAEEHLDLIAGCGTNVSFHDGEYVFAEGDEANTFYAIRRGAVALEIGGPARSPLVIETLEAGDVLGWSWLFPPYLARFGARAVGELRTIAFDGACLRGKCEDDHEFGYQLMRRFAQIAIGRLQAARIQLLDVYGEPAARA